MPENSNVETDVLIIGAGAAGLTVLAELHRAGLEALCLEARDRIGGRIFTIRDEFSPVPIELGAEFIHGRSPDIWDLLRSARLAAYDCGEKAVRIEEGKVRRDPDAWETIHQVLDEMQRFAERHDDCSFVEFLKQTSYPDRVKRLALSYVEGFNAARSDVVGIASLSEDMRAADAIGGDRSFRNMSGYSALMEAIPGGSEKPAKKLRLNCIVERIEWQRGSATVYARSGITGGTEKFECKRVVLTVPLGVLQAGTIAIDPEPGNMLVAARKLRFGQAARIVLRFRDAFWESDPELAEAGFLLSQERYFPTWWTALPIHAPVITGWCAGPRVDLLAGQSREAILSHALADLAKITQRSPESVAGLLEAAHFHDWDADPFARGAYSYVPAGALEARKVLAHPVAETLYFAGEATDLEGHSATVHGAIASGKRVAREIVAPHSVPGSM